MSDVLHHDDDDLSPRAVRIALAVAELGFAYASLLLEETRQLHLDVLENKFDLERMIAATRSKLEAVAGNQEQENMYRSILSAYEELLVRRAADDADMRQKTRDLGDELMRIYKEIEENKETLAILMEEEE